MIHLSNNKIALQIKGLQIVFENMKIMSGYKYYLTTGLQTGD